MTTKLLARKPAEAHAPTVFDRVVVGVDGSEASFEACRQAARLVAPDGWLEVFAAVYLIEARLAGWSPEEIEEALAAEAGDAVAKARAIAGPRAQARLVNGPALQTLTDELRRTGASLVAVGAHGHSRVSEIVAGGLSGTLLHRAPCAVLLARRPAAEALFPRTLVAGVDGSAEGAAALAAARYLARRFEARLRVVTAVGDGGGADLASARLQSPAVEAIDDHPVRALVEASQDADLLVVGSRGLQGLKALGSVSERVAHRARCSVLVVRPRPA